jgi:protein arginine N-methyltransferase 1
MADARRRHLKDGGVMIPARIRQFVVPVIADRFHRELAAWDDVGFGLDLSAAREMSFNNVYVRSFTSADLLDGGAAAKVWDEVVLGTDTRSARKGEESWALDRTQTIYGFAYWWEAELVPGIMLSTAPRAARTHWEQLYFPLREPLEIAAGESVLLSLRSTSSEDAGTHLAWTAVHFDREGASKARQAMDLDKGWIP